MWQYPSRVNLHFYNYLFKEENKMRLIVAIPFTGEPSFLRLIRALLEKHNAVWQYPSRVNLHFYGILSRTA